MTPIKIFIVDDHPMIVSGLKHMLEDNDTIVIIGAFQDETTFLNALEEQQPDVILLDIQLSEKNGDELTPIILTLQPDAKILTLTNFDSLLYLQTMLRLGVRGYILKTTTQANLIEAIQTVFRNETFIDPALQEKLAARSQLTDKKIYSKLSLTLREQEIARLLAKGYDNKAIAQQLFIGYNTVRNYRARIFAKLEVNSISELVNKALTLGI